MNATLYVVELRSGERLLASSFESAKGKAEATAIRKIRRATSADIDDHETAVYVRLHDPNFIEWLADSYDAPGDRCPSARPRDARGRFIKMS